MKHNERFDPPLARPSVVIRTAVDCAVCSQGYAGTLSYHCSKCSEASSIVSSVCTIIITGLLGLLFVYYMVSIEGVRTPRVSFDRVKAVLPLQSVKIIVISWQIVTQVRTVDEVCSNIDSLYCCIPALLYCCTAFFEGGGGILAPLLHQLLNTHIHTYMHA